MTARRLKKDKKWTLIKFCFFLYVFISVFALIWMRMAVVNLEYELSQLGKQKMALVRDGKLVSAERANLYSVAKIEEIAIKQLGMGFPKRERIFFVKKTRGAASYKASIKSVSESSVDTTVVPTRIEPKFRDVSSNHTVLKKYE